MSMVLELQQSIYNKTASTSEVLLKAYTISRKLNLTDIAEWLQNEMNGYEKKEIPSYRIIIGTVEAFNPYYGWYPVIFENEKIKSRAEELYFNYSILQAEAIAKNAKEGIIYLTTGATELMVNELKTKVRLVIGDFKIKNVLETVNNTVLEWTLSLEEKGILGENMQFTKKEKDEAKAITIMNINGNNTKINNNSIDNSINNLNSSELHQELGRLITKLEQLEDDCKDEISSLILGLKEEQKKEKPNKKMIELFLQGLPLISPIIDIGEKIRNLF